MRSHSSASWLGCGARRPSSRVHRALCGTSNGNWQRASGAPGNLLRRTGCVVTHRSWHGRSDCVASGQIRIGVPLTTRLYARAQRVSTRTIGAWSNSTICLLGSRHGARLSTAGGWACGMVPATTTCSLRTRRMTSAGQALDSTEPRGKSHRAGYRRRSADPRSVADCRARPCPQAAGGQGAWSASMLTWTMTTMTRPIGGSHPPTATAELVAPNDADWSVHQIATAHASTDSGGRH